MCVGVDAASVQSDVHFDQHINVAPGVAQRIRPPPGDVRVIDDEGKPSTVEQCYDARGVNRMQRVG
jgi:hypothetical protein